MTRVNSTSRLVEWFEPRILKSGRPGKSGTWFCAFYTPLRWCELCGRFSTPRNIRAREDLYDAWLMEWRKYEPIVLCVGCWNRLRPIFKELRDLQELRVIARRMARGVV